MKHNISTLLCFLVLGFLISRGSPLVYSQSASEKASALSEIGLISDKGRASIVRNVISECHQAFGKPFGLVGFSTITDLGFSSGSGLFVAPDKIATIFHVAAIISVGPGGAKLTLSETIWAIEGVVAFDVKNDLAILKIAGKGTPLSIGDSDTLTIGESVYLAGYPYGGEYKVAEGIIDGIRQSDKWIRTTTKAYPGNSGNPVLNSKGNV